MKKTIVIIGLAMASMAGRADDLIVAAPIESHSNGVEYMQINQRSKLAYLQGVVDGLSITRRIDKSTDSHPA